MSANKALLDSTVRNQIYLEGLKADQVLKLNTFLKRVDKDLRLKLTSQDLTAFNRARIEKLLLSVDKSLNGIFQTYENEFKKGLVEIAQYEAEFEARSLENALDEEGFEAVIPAPNQVKAAVFSQPLTVRGADGGKLLDTYIADWSRTDKNRFVNAIRQGFFEGQTNFQIIQALRGTKARNYQDGVIGLVGRNAEAMVRTSIQQVASVARFETWQQNTNVVKGFIWVSTLDSSTSDICRALDGQVFELDAGVRPPAHIRCRSTTIAQLDKKYDFLDEGRTRASRNLETGKTVKIDAKNNYYDWLKDQSEEFQDEILGKTRAKLFRDGGLTPDQFRDLQLDKRFKPLTLEEMKKKEPNAFKRAFSKPEPVKTEKRFTGETLEKDFHNASFGKSRDELVDVIKRASPVEVINKPGTAYASGGKTINMAGKDINLKDTQDTWRHEFGHILDVQIGRKTLSRRGYVSSRPDFESLMGADADKLKSVRGNGRRKKDIERFRDLKEKVYSAIDQNLNTSPKLRVKYNQELAKKAGLDYDKLTEMLIETTGKTDFSEYDSAYRLANIIEAIRLTDAERFYNFGVKKDLYAKGGMTYSEYVSIARYDGWFGSFSDLVGALTKNTVCNPVNGFPGHPTSYYKKAGHKSGTEFFANLTATYGHPNHYVWEIVKRFVPETSAKFLEVLNDL